MGFAAPLALRVVRLASRGRFALPDDPMLGLQMTIHIIAQNPVATERRRSKFQHPPHCDQKGNAPRAAHAPFRAIQHLQRLAMLSETVEIVEAPDPAEKETCVIHRHTQGLNKQVRTRVPAQSEPDTVHTPVGRTNTVAAQNACGHGISGGARAARRWGSRRTGTCPPGPQTP